MTSYEYNYEDENNKQFYEYVRNGNLKLANMFYFKVNGAINIGFDNNIAFRTACYENYYDIVSWLYYIEPGKINLLEKKIYNNVEGTSTLLRHVLKWSINYGHIKIVKLLYHLILETWYSMNGTRNKNFNNVFNEYHNALVENFRYASLSCYIDIVKWILTIDKGKCIHMWDNRMGMEHLFDEIYYNPHYSDYHGKPGQNIKVCELFIKYGFIPRKSHPIYYYYKQLTDKQYKAYNNNLNHLLCLMHKKKQFYGKNILIQNIQKYL